ADGYREDAAGRLDRLALFDGVDVAEHDGADRALVEVEGEADRAILELEELVDAGVGQARDAGDAVPHFGDAADGPGFERGLVAGQVLRERRSDVGGGEGEFSHWNGRPLMQWSCVVRASVRRAGGDGNSQT